MLNKIFRRRVNTNIFVLRVFLKEEGITAELLEDLHTRRYSKAQKRFFKKYLTYDSTVICKDGQPVDTFNYNGHDIAGLTMKDGIFPCDDTTYALLKTDSGFLCLFSKHQWERRPLDEIYLMSWEDGWRAKITLTR